MFHDEQVEKSFSPAIVFPIITGLLACWYKHIIKILNYFVSVDELMDN